MATLAVAPVAGTSYRRTGYGTRLVRCATAYTVIRTGVYCTVYAHTPTQGDTTTHAKLSKNLLHKQVKRRRRRRQFTCSSHALALAAALGDGLVLELLARNLVRGSGKCTLGVRVRVGVGARVGRGTGTGTGTGRGRGTGR